MLETAGAGPKDDVAGCDCESICSRELWQRENLTNAD